MPKYHIEFETSQMWGVDIVAENKDEALERFKNGEHGDPYRMYDEDFHGVDSCELVEDER